MFRKSIAGCLALAVVGGVASSWADEKAAERKISEKLVVKFPPSFIPDSLKASPDSKRVAYLAKSGSKWTVVVGGKEGKAYDGIGEGPVFSSDQSIPPDSPHIDSC